MERKLAKLERKTQQAILTLIRELFFDIKIYNMLSDLRSGQRLHAQKGDTADLVGAMDAQQQVDEADASDED